MVFVKPVLLSSGEKTLVDEFAAVGYHGDVLKAKIWLVAEFVLRLCFLYHDDVLDTDSETAIFIVSRFVGNHIAWC